MVKGLKVLHLSEITRFSNWLRRLASLSSFYTYLKLQGSQTAFLSSLEQARFYTYLKLQGSQTGSPLFCPTVPFYTYLKLQGSQTSNGHHRTYIPGGIVTSDIFILQLNTCLCL